MYDRGGVLCSAEENFQVRDKLSTRRVDETVYMKNPERFSERGIARGKERMRRRSKLHSNKST